MANIHGADDVWKNAMERLKFRLDFMLETLDKLLEVRKKEAEGTTSAKVHSMGKQRHQCRADPYTSDE